MLWIKIQYHFHLNSNSSKNLLKLKIKSAKVWDAVFLKFLDGIISSHWSFFRVQVDSRITQGPNMNVCESREFSTIRASLNSNEKPMDVPTVLKPKLT